ncbi:MAG: NAD(P)-binding protein [Gammaproteobacteria bacterium]|nr:NAD(P)-binding protein [Gammaproteobacteria bacterium]
MIDVIVVGAGWSGLTAATRLAARGHSVVVVDKSRGPGGRSATRRADNFSFDHGAQYLTARSEAFRRQVRAWAESGLLAPWRPGIVTFGDRPADAGRPPDERWVGVPGMNAVLHQLARGLDCRWQWQTVGAARRGPGWRVEGPDGEALEGRALLITAPPRQAGGLLGPDHALHDRLVAVDMQPCWAVMLGYASPREPGFDAAFVNRGPLAWIAHNGGKPGRGNVDAWVVHAETGWSNDHLEDPAEAVVEAAIAALAELAPALAQSVTHSAAHRWRFAQPRGGGQGSSSLSRDSERLVLAGDWCAGGRIEGAWISGVAAARRLDAML